jgi:hypothetical protein
MFIRRYIPEDVILQRFHCCVVQGLDKIDGVQLLSIGQKQFEPTKKCQKKVCNLKQ